MALWGSALAAGGFSATTMLFSLGAEHDSGWCGSDAGPEG
ncbi:tail assembly I domain protein [Escherichia coli DEC10F]|nr:tail assembly I domain protein [Escherichia coli DEC10F]